MLKRLRSPVQASCYCMLVPRTDDLQIIIKFVFVHHLMLAFSHDPPKFVSVSPEMFDFDTLPVIVHDLSTSHVTWDCTTIWQTRCNAHALILARLTIFISRPKQLLLQPLLLGLLPIRSLPEPLALCRPRPSEALQPYCSTCIQHNRP